MRGEGKEIEREMEEGGKMRREGEGEGEKGREREREIRKRKRERERKMNMKEIERIKGERKAEIGYKKRLGEVK